LRFGMRIEVLDEKSNWLESFVCEEKNNSVKFFNFIYLL
jgi:hypothetical protein